MRFSNNPFHTLNHHNHIILVDTSLWLLPLIGAIRLYLYPHTRPWAKYLPEPTFIHHDKVFADFIDNSDSIMTSLPIFTCNDAHSCFNDNNNANNKNGSNPPDTSNEEDTVHSLVVNLSSFHLNRDAIDILSKGIKFCPTSGEPDMSKAQNDLESFHLRLKRSLHFYAPPKDDTSVPSNSLANPPGPQTGPFKDPKFKNPSSWVPPPCIPLEVFIAQNKSDLINSTFRAPRRQNITRQQRDAIKALQSNKDIIIKPADKGGAMVILNKEDYIREGLRQLSDANFYLKTNTDLSSKHQVDDMVTNEEIDKSCADYLCSPEFRTSKFYMLPKIHKRLDNPPGRPIVSGNGCPTERISQFVDFFLKPIVQDTTFIYQRYNTFPEPLKGTGNPTRQHSLSDTRCQQPIYKHTK